MSEKVKTYHFPTFSIMYEDKDHGLIVYTVFVDGEEIDKGNMFIGNLDFEYFISCHIVEMQKGSPWKH